MLKLVLPSRLVIEVSDDDDDDDDGLGGCCVYVL
jgi:hypothetical protein